jgi:pyrimidine-nucleoside phosphorylase
MSYLSLIEAKRNRQTHTQSQIQDLVKGVTSGEMPDYQLAAWLMAAYLNGLTPEETIWLTQAFVDSGKTLDLSSVDGLVVDKHSTGGVGDKVTLVLAPLLASAGFKVAKLSGRGLGFTGGTIDKLEAIPGFQTERTQQQFVQQLQSVGIAISGQSSELTPADAHFYALRDVTATVDNIPLIASSVVSKKIAAGAHIIVLDIKYGRGAFMPTLEKAQELASLCQKVGQALGREMITCISSMETPLGQAVGHSLEVLEAVETLKGKGPKDLEDLCLSLGAKVLCQAKRYETESEATDYLKSLFASGEALKAFEHLVKAQGGEVEALHDPNLLPQPDRVGFLPASVSGTIRSIDPLLVASAVHSLGGGRLKKGDPIHHGVGVILRCKVGDVVEEGDTLVELHACGKCYGTAQAQLKEAIVIESFPEI